MRFLDFLDEINEAKFRKPIGMYHGTSDAFLQSILKNGIVPDPTAKVWQDDPAASASSASRESLSGSYWTSNMMTASSSAWSAAKKFGGNQLMVLADIAEQSAFADEDSINGSLDWAFADAANTYGLSGSAVINIASMYYNDWKGARDKITKAYVESLHDKLLGGDKHPIDDKLLSRALESYMMRMLAHAKKNGEFTYRSEELKSLPEIPSVEEAEQDWLRVRGALTKQYRATAYKEEGGFSHTLRMTEPVTYRGSNKITGLLGDPPRKSEPGKPDPDWYSRPKILYYGKVSQDYINQYNERIGEFPGVVDQHGNTIIPSGRSES